MLERRQRFAALAARNRQCFFVMTLQSLLFTLGNTPSSRT